METILAYFRTSKLSLGVATAIGWILWGATTSITYIGNGIIYGLNKLLGPSLAAMVIFQETPELIIVVAAILLPSMHFVNREINRVIIYGMMALVAIHLVVLVTRLALDLTVSIARYAIPALKIGSQIAFFAWFGVCVLYAIYLFRINNYSRALEIIGEVAVESVKEIGEFLLELFFKRNSD